ncbi:MAG: tRNA (adenosine(37)-N6)-dimethylallyltransferase MiaA [Desulfovibrio sp.]
MSSKKPIVCLLGPTGTGKTASIVAIADRLKPVVINFDSRQVYEDFPIITAQPTEEEQAVCPHLLYGFLPSSEKITAARFAEMAQEAIDEVHAAGRLPVLVGGTGLYLRALLEGLAPIPEIPEEIHDAVVMEVEEKGSPVLHEALTEFDPEYAAKIHPNDRQRIARATEVFRATGQSLSDWHSQEHKKAPYDSLKVSIRLDLDALTPRLDGRIEEMIRMGAVNEAKRAWEVTPDPEAPAWSGIGCAELLAYIRSELSLDEARRQWAHNTRQYAKRQITWCKKEKNMLWFEPGEHEKMADAVLSWLQDRENC